MKMNKSILGWLATLTAVGGLLGGMAYYHYFVKPLPRSMLGSAIVTCVGLLVVRVINTLYEKGQGRSETDNVDRRDKQG